MFAAHAQEKPSTGDLYDGLTRPLTFNRVIPPYALEVTFSMVREGVGDVKPFL